MKQRYYNEQRHSLPTYNMKERPFREHHLLMLLEQFENEGGPLDLAIHRYFRAHRALGSKDRGEIAETIYALVRWKGLLDHLSSSPLSWEKRFELFHTLPLSSFAFSNPSSRPSADSMISETGSLPIHIALSFPKELYNLLVESHGEDLAKELCWASNYPAPTTVRINRLKTTREEVLKLWKGKHPVSPCLFAEEGIFFHKKCHFFEMDEFKAGLFEIQDEGSQLLANLMQAKPGDHVLDFCSGSGGKTLAFAHRLQGKGQVYLHDIRPFILQEARKRLKRAGIQNVQVMGPEDPQLKKLKRRMDWVLVDAPCTGTGTLRRNPDMKWKFNGEMLGRLVSQQRTIFEKALSFVKPGGYIVYATCSLLKQENQDQVTHFLKTYPLELVEAPFQSLPLEEGEKENEGEDNRPRKKTTEKEEEKRAGSRAMDGFFGAVFRRKMD